MKKTLKGWGFFSEYRKVEGVLGKNASPLPPPRWENRGGAGGSPVWPNPAAKGPRRLRGKGKGGGAGRVRLPAMAQTEVARGGLAMVAGGNGRRWSLAGGSGPR